MALQVIRLHGTAGPVRHLQLFRSGGDLWARSQMGGGGESKYKELWFFHALELLCINNSNNNDKSGEFILPLFDFVQMKQV